jgi:hypothetical protein
LDEKPGIRPERKLPSAPRLERGILQDTPSAPLLKKKGAALRFTEQCLGWVIKGWQADDRRATQGEILF